VTEVGSAYVSILPSAKGFGSKLDKELSGGAEQSGRKAGKRAGEGIHKGLAVPLAKVTGALAGAFAVDRAVTFLKGAIDSASDLSESGSKVGVVFGKNRVIVDRFARTAARSMGITEQAALEASGTLGNLFVALKLPQREAAKMSTKMVALASDLASFNNVDPAEALDALRSGLVGETEPLRRFGVNMNDATLHQEALKLGLIKSVKDGLTPAMKAQAAYALILDQTTTAQGDFTRTSGGLANQQRIMAAQWGDLKAKIGTELLPVMIHLARFTNDEIIPAISGFVDGIRNGTGAGGKFADVVGDLGDQAKAAWHLAEPMLAFIGDHPHLFAEVAKDATIFAVAMKGISTVKKLPGLSSLLGGKGGLLGQAATLAKPLPVFVTNAGLGKGGAGGPTILGGPKGTVPEGRFGKILASSLTAQAVLLGDVVLGEKAAAGLKNTIFPLRFNLSVNDAAKEFLDKIQSPDTDKVTRSILEKHYAAVFAGVAEAARTGNTEALQKALTETYAEVASKAEAIRKQIAADTARDTANNVKLVSGGFLTIQDLAQETGTKISARIGGGLTAAKDRVDGLNAKLQGITPPIQEGVDKAGEFLTTLTDVNAIKPDVTIISNLDPAADKADHLFNRLQQLDGKRVTSYAQVYTTLHAPGHGSDVVGYASGTLNATPGWHWVGENGPELMRMRGGEQVYNQSQLASLPSGGGGGGLTIEQLNVTSAPHEPAETSVPRTLRNLVWANEL
jgi:hypothetical protein